MIPAPTSQRVTMRDLARRLKVSHTTISRAMRDDHRISEAMRQKVQALAQEMGHRPDPMLSALAHYRRGRNALPISAEIAWINPWHKPEKLCAFKEFKLYWEGASAEATRCGFRLEEFRLGKDPSLERLQKIFHTRNVRGILLPPCGEDKPDYHDFDWASFCIVRFGHSFSFPHAHLVSSDQLTDGAIAFENIWRNGYRRIGLVTSSKMHTRFSAGFLFGELKSNSKVHLPTLVLNQTDQDEDCGHLKSWLKTNKPDAILTDVSELRGLLAQIGWKVPKDIGLAALSVLDGNADAGINQNSYEIGRAAVQLLISLINHNEIGIPQICRELLIEGWWVNGSTLPPKTA